MHGGYEKEGGVGIGLKGKLKAKLHIGSSNSTNKSTVVGHIEDQTSDLGKHSNEHNDPSGASIRSSVTNRIAPDVASEIRAPIFVEKSLEENGEENVAPPVRILLKILDSIFDLRKDKWLNRAVHSVIVSIVRGLFGGDINNTVRDAINVAISEEQLAGSIIQLREAIWPGGSRAPEAPPRSNDSKIRTRVEAKAKLFGLLPDSIRSLVGKENAKIGILRLHDMLQYNALNKRLAYVVQLTQILDCKKESPNQPFTADHQPTYRYVLMEATVTAMFPDQNWRALLPKIRREKTAHSGGEKGGAN